MSEKKNRKKKQHNKYLVLTSLPVQMGVTIYLGSYLGKEISKNTGNKHFTTIFVLLSVVVALYLFIKQVKKISND